jgi:hypothetical protein
MTSVLEEYNTEEQRSIAWILWANGLDAKGIHKEIFFVYGGKSVYRVKRVATGSRNSL